MAKNKLFLLLGIMVFALLSLFIVYMIFSKLSKISKDEQVNYAAPLEQITQQMQDDISLELTASPNDIFIGNERAPVTIIAYDSFSCPHCAFFYENIFPLLKVNYIDTGKVKFIHRDFPLDIQALTASKLLKCFTTLANNARAFDMILGVFSTQKDWAFSENYTTNLSNIFEFGDMQKEDVAECLKDEDLENRILEDRMRASKVLKVNATPTFFINGKKLEREPSFAVFSEEIDALISK